MSGLGGREAAAGAGPGVGAAVMPRWRALVLAARPRTLPAAAAPVLIGTACAFAVGGFRLLPAVAALVGALAIQVATNYANDVHDFERGTDTPDRLGPLRATLAGLLTPREMKVATAGAFGVAVLVGLYLAAVAGWPVIAIGAASIVAGLAYTAGPYPLAEKGVAEPFVLVFFGFVAVAGTAFVQAGRVPPSAWWGGLVAGAFTTAILVVNNTRDHASDRRAGRRTIPARFGRRAGVAELAGLLALGYAGTAAAAVLRGAPLPSLAALLTLPLAIRLVRVVAGSEDGPTLNRALADAGRLLLVHSTLLAAGIASVRWLP